MTIRGATAALLLLVGCSDDAAVEASETTGADDTADSGAETEIGADTSTSTPAPESSGPGADMSSSESSSESSSSDESSTGEPDEDVLELLVRGRSPTDEYGIFRYRRVDGVAEELVRLAPDTAAGASDVMFFADRRAVFAWYGALWLGELDGDEDAATRLDVAPLAVGPYEPTAAIPGAEAVVVVNQGDRSAYRIDVEGGVAEAPVLVAHDILPEDYGPNGVVDPLGRWLMFDLDEGRANVALAPLDVPDEDPIQITSEVAPASARFLGFLPDGGGLLYQELVDVGDIYDPATALYFVGLDGTSMATAQLVVSIAAPDTIVHSWAPHPLGLGFAFVVGPEYGPRDLWFAGVVDGVAGAAVRMVEDGFAIARPTWSPDGTQLAVETYDANDGSGGLALVAVVDGVPGPLVPVETLPPARSVELRTVWFAPDGSWMYFEHPEGEDVDIVRVAPTDDGWDDWQVVAADVRELHDLSADGSMLVYEQSGGAPDMLAVDVSGAVPGVAVEIGTPLPADVWNVDARLTPDGRFALLQQELGGFGPYRLQLVDLAVPDEASDVIEDFDAVFMVPQR